jgi:hypothetical protein
LKRLSTFFFLTLLSLVCAFPAAAAVDEDAPAWLQADAKVPTPSFEIRDVPAVVLRKEESVQIASDGTVIRTIRGAIRVLTKSGRSRAYAQAIYTTDSDKVKDMDGWLIARTGKVTHYGKKEVIDIALSTNDLYNEARKRVIDASDDAVEGDVFGYEVVLQERSVFSQFQFLFQNNLPALSSTFQLSLPDGWRAESVTFNHEKIVPNVAGSSYTWALGNLKPINPEPNSPSYYSLAPRIAVSFYPAAATATQIKTFANWNDVAKWMAEIEDPMMTVDDSLAAKVQELTANAKTEFEKIQAISKYVQNIQYISIQIGTGRGGGYRPRSATEVFAKSYGDCKDKANLMRAMLSVLKIPAYLVSITADDPSFVQPEWPSPHQFNHCIIAIKISDASITAPVVMHPALGRVLIFDPTDPYTPLGDLPEDEQGSWALIDHRDTQELLQMPVMPAEVNGSSRSIEAALNVTGGITGSISEEMIGQNARRQRAAHRGLSTAEYDQFVNRWVTRGITGASTKGIKVEDVLEEGKFNRDVSFEAPAYAQVMQGRLMVFKPAVIGRLDQLSFSDEKRMTPYMIESVSYSEKVKIKLPEGFAVDEIPENLDLKADFGKYTSSYTVEGDSIVFSRSLRLRRSEVPAEKYGSIKDFFSQIHNAEKSPVVLMKK